MSPNNVLKEKAFSVWLVIDIGSHGDAPINSRHIKGFRFHWNLVYIRIIGQSNVVFSVDNVPLPESILREHDHVMTRPSSLVALYQNPLVIDGFPSEGQQCEPFKSLWYKPTKLLNKHSNCHQWSKTIMWCLHNITDEVFGIPIPSQCQGIWSENPTLKCLRDYPFRTTDLIAKDQRVEVHIA